MFEWNDGTDYLMHYGTKGQKWGIRLYQNPDGSLTPLGRIHYGIGQKAKNANLLGPAKQAIRDMRVNSYKKKIQQQEAKEIESEGYEQFLEKRIGKWSLDDAGKDSELSPEAKKLMSMYGSDFKSYYSNIGGNKIWNRLANAKDDHDRLKAIAKSVIEQALRKNKKPDLGAEEGYAVEEWITQIDELIDFTGAHTNKDRRNAFEYSKRFERRSY